MKSVLLRLADSSLYCFAVILNVLYLYSPPDRGFGFGTCSSLTGATIVEEAMDTSTATQPMTVCGPGAQPHSTGIPRNFHTNR